MNKTCETCRYYFHKPIDANEAALGAMFGVHQRDRSQCRRYAPKAEGWPRTYRVAWCGEWAEKQEEGK